MAIAYIVTDGDYSSYGICAVFSAKDKAEDYIRVCRPSGQVEEWEIDSDVGKVPRLLYRTQVQGQEITYDGVELDAVDHASKRTPDNPITVPPGFDGFWAESYVSAEHAHKLAVEEIQRRLREHS